MMRKEVNYGKIKKRKRKRKSRGTIEEKKILTPKLRLQYSSGYLCIHLESLSPPSAGASVHQFPPSPANQLYSKISSKISSIV